jgi:hypothetical protein
MEDMDNKISAFTASLPGRVKILEKAVASILPQVDSMQVVLNNYKTVPKFLHHPKIKVVHSDNRYQDGSRFIDIDLAPPGFVLVFDDDVIYPKDYVKVLSEQCGFNRMVTPMGKIMRARPISSYYKDIYLAFRAFEEVKDTYLVDVPGCCGILWHNRDIKVTIKDLPIPNSDVCLAKFCKENNILATVIPHKADWLKSIWHEVPKNTQSIYGTYRHNDQILTDFINKYV